MVEIGGGEGRIIGGQEPVGAVIEALAGDVHIVGIEHAMHKAGRHPPRRQPGRSRHRGVEQACGVRGLWEIGLDQERHQALHRRLVVLEQQALEGAEADMAVAQPDQDRRPRRRGLVAAHQGFAGLDQRQGLRRRHAQRFQHGGRQHLAHAALQRQSAVTAARPGRGARALGAEVEQSALIVHHLGEQKAAAVAEVGIVDAKLMAVIAQGQRRRLVAGQGLEAAEMANPVGVAQTLKADRGGRPVIAIAQHGLRKVRGRNLVEQGQAAGGETRRRTVGHDPAWQVLTSCHDVSS